MYSISMATITLTRDIGEAERTLRALLERQLAGAGLSFPEWAVLSFLDGAPLDRGKLVRALEAAGLVSREGNPTDTRAVQLDLTPVGVETADRAVAIVLALQDEITAPLGGPDSERTREFRAALQALLTGEQP